MSDQPDDIPTGFSLEYHYEDPDDVCRRRDTATYVGEPLTMEVIQQRIAERKALGDE